MCAPRPRPARWCRAAKLPPLGERSNTGIFPHLQYRSFPAEETAKAINDATMVIVQFESADCLANAPTRSSRSKASTSCWSA